MLNKLKSTIVGMAIVSSSLIAGNFDPSIGANSLVGIEAGYSSLDHEFGTALNNSQSQTGMPSGGLKIGAETENYRIFLSGRYFYDTNKDYDYITTYGAEVQYKFNPSKAFNFFIGANAGIANLKWRSDTETFSRTISTYYFGGDLGVNVHLKESLDWEIGARVMSLDDTNTMSSVTYRVNTMVSGYTSIIFKWQMD